MTEIEFDLYFEHYIEEKNRNSRVRTKAVNAAKALYKWKNKHHVSTTTVSTKSQ